MKIKEILLAIALFWFILCQDLTVYNIPDLIMLANIPVVLMLFLIWMQNNGKGGRK